MKLVRTLGSLAAVAALVCQFGCGKGKPEAGAEAPAVTLTYANFPPAKTFPCVQMEHWREQVEEKSGGKVKVNTIPGSQLLGAKNMLDGVIDGTADIGCLAMSYHPGQFPLSEAVDMPHFFPSGTCATMVLHDLIEKYQPKEFEKVELLAVFTCPPAAVMTSEKVTSLADLKGMTLRVSGTGAEVMKRLGAVPMAMPQSDTPPAIQKGTVKGIVSSMEVLQDMNYAAYCPYALKADLNVITFAVVMNREKFVSLSDEARDAVKSMAREQALWTGQYVDQHVTDALAWAAKEKGHTLTVLSDAEMAEVKAKLRPLVDDYIKRADAAGLPGAQIIKDIEVLKEKYAGK